MRQEIFGIRADDNLFLYVYLHVHVEIETADDVSIGGDVNAFGGITYGKAHIDGNLDAPVVGLLGSVSVGGDMKSSSYIGSPKSIKVGGDVAIGDYLSVGGSISTDGTLTAESK